MPFMRFGPLMSSRAISRTLGTRLRGRGLEHRVPQLPLAVLALPQVRRAELIGERHEVLAAHRRLLEHFRRLRKLVRGDAEVTEDFRCEALRELAVEPPHESDA